METSRAFYRIDKSRIGFLRFIFEAHDGIAVVTTMDAPSGLVRVTMAPGCEEDVRAVLHDLKRKFLIHEV